MENYQKIFRGIENTIQIETGLKKEDFDKLFLNHKSLNKKTFTNEEIWKLFVNVIFNSGFKASTVTHKLNDIYEVFGDYKKMCLVKYEDINSLIKNKKIINNEKKIKAILNNAKKFEEIIKKHKTFLNFIESYGDLNNIDNLNLLKKAIMKDYKFGFIGEVTIYHLFTDLGLNVVKPDRVLNRVFNRIGLISNDNENEKIIKICQEISKSTNEPIRYIDLIFVLFGQIDKKPEFCLNNGICLNKNPRCEKCQINNLCKYYASKK